MFPRTERPRRWIDAGRAAAVLLLASAALAGCAVPPKPTPETETTERLTLQRASVRDLPGW